MMINHGYKSRLLAFVFFIPACTVWGQGYLGVSAGGSSAQLSHQAPQIAYVSGNTITDAYPLNNTRSSKGLFSVNGGYEFTRESWPVNLALGLGVYGNLSDYHYSGLLVETAAGDPASTLYRYDYKANSTRLMAEALLTWAPGKLSPFVAIGVGPAFNRMSAWRDTAINNGGYPPLPPFQSHRQVNLAWQTGAGLSTSLQFSHASSGRVSLGYRYADLGTTSFGTRGSEYPWSLNTGRLATNELYLAYTHLF